MTRLELHLLGPFGVTLDGEPVKGFAFDKVRALLAYLAVEGRQAHRREALAGLLWPDYPDSDALVSLRQAVHKLRQALGDGAANGSPPFLLVTPQTVQFDANSYSLDEFSALVEACRTHRHRKADQCSTCHARYWRAAELYRGDFLAGFLLQDAQAFDEWLVLRREALSRQAVVVFERLAAYYETRGEYEQALKYVYRQLEMEPWREDAHRQAMRLLVLDGRRAAAIAQYETCRRVLHDQLGIEPEPETVALYEGIRAGDLRDDGRWTMDDREPSSIVHRPSSIVLAAPPLVGREEELATIIGLLDSPDYRLITLIGLGGVGKTRLAQQAASEQAGTFDDGICFIPLAAVSTPALLASSIAQAVGLHFGPTAQLDAQLIDWLRDREMLLVLDNFEHLIDGGTDLVVSILNNAPKTAILVTSRERLGLQAEYLVDVSGLPYPELDDGRWTMDDGRWLGTLHRPSSIVHRLRLSLRPVVRRTGKAGAIAVRAVGGECARRA